MPTVGGLDIHRKQVPFDYPGTGTGQVCRGQVSPADRLHLLAWLARFAGRDDVAFAVEGCTGWRYVTEELALAGVAAHRLHGVGPVTALAITCWLGGAARFSSSRNAVRFTGLDVTVCSPDRKGPPGRLSRQGPPVLRWAVYEAGTTHARSSAPDYRYYAQVKDRCNGKRAALSEARKILRQACHILTELGDDALTAA